MTMLRCPLPSDLVRRKAKASFPQLGHSIASGTTPWAFPLLGEEVGDDVVDSFCDLFDCAMPVHHMDFLIETESFVQSVL